MQLYWHVHLAPSQLFDDAKKLNFQMQIKVPPDLLSQFVFSFGQPCAVFSFGQPCAPNEAFCLQSATATGGGRGVMISATKSPEAPDQCLIKFFLQSPRGGISVEVDYFYLYFGTVHILSE